MRRIKRGYIRDAAAEYDRCENIVSSPPNDVPGAVIGGAGPLLIWSSKLPAVGDMLAQSPEVVWACPRPLVPGEKPPPRGVLLSILEVEGEGMTGGGRACIRE